MRNSERQADVQQAVEEDFRLHYRVTDTTQFLDKLLPVEPDIVNKILQKMKDIKIYDPRSNMWAGFPKLGTEFTENCLYGPFNTVVEAIRLAAEELRTGTAEVGATMWADYHSRSPKSHDTQGADIRPDVLFALKLLAERAKSKNPKGREADGSDSFGFIWWLQIIALAEVKRTDHDKWDSLIKQLMGYLRRILWEQLDRRFVFGLTLGPATMTVWMHDRFGVLGTRTSINFHENPAKFVQVIAAFTLLPPERLGFDPTIKLLVSTNQAVPSYRPTSEFIDAYKAAPYNRRWVITMNNQKQFVTIRTQSCVQAGFLRGRGSIVWVVVPYGEGRQEQESESKLFVLKQSWQPREVEGEGKLYDAANGAQCENVGKIELWEDVVVSGEPDTTDELIRQGLDDSTGLGKRPPIQRPGRKEDFIHVVTTNVHDIEEVQARELGPPVSRVRTRVVLSTYGWTIKYFSTLSELVRVLRDAVRGHKYLYSNGVLHRDVSPGNILIEWHSGSEANKPSTSGRLIDLDRGKRGNSYPSSSQVTATPADDSDERGKSCPSPSQATAAGAGDGDGDDSDDNDNPHETFEWGSRRRLGSDVVHQALEFFPVRNQDNIRVITYMTAAVQHALKFKHLTKGNICTVHNLQWKQVEKLYSFDFHVNQLRKGSRTGTPPYTSGEILSNVPYFSDPDAPHHPVYHDAVHDIESFFWVLVNICLTREGPGGDRREELREANDDDDDDDDDVYRLRRVVFCLFDSDEDLMSNNKRLLFTTPTDLEEYVLKNFHPYFHGLRGLVEEWFYILRLAHNFHAAEYHNIHDMVLKILEKALGSTSLGDINNAGQRLLDKRKEEIERALSSIDSFGTCQAAPIPTLSPKTQRVSQSHSQDQGQDISPPSSPTRMPPPSKRLRSQLGGK